VIGEKLKNISLRFDVLRTNQNTNKRDNLQIESKSDLLVSKKGAAPAQRLLLLGWFHGWWLWLGSIERSIQFKR
jgi:hypothetical protein